MERKLSTQNIQHENHQAVVERYIHLRNKRINEERSRGWDPLIDKFHYDELAYKHPQILAAYMDTIENRVDQFGTYILDIAEFAPNHALSLQTLIKEDFNWRRIYAQNAKNFKGITTEIINSGEIIPETRLSATDDEEKVRGFLSRNQKYVRRLCQRLQKEGIKPKYALSDLKFLVEKIGKIYQGDAVRVWFNLVYNKKNFLDSIIVIYLDVPFPDQEDNENFGRVIYDLRMFPDGRLKSGERTFVRGGDIEGYMFFKPTEHMLHWQKKHTMQIVFNEEALIQTIIESRDLNDGRTQKKIRETLSRVETKIKSVIF